MRRNPFIKTIFRRPFHSILMLLLIGIVSYSIISHVVEYIIVLQTTTQLEKYYRPIGVLTSEDYDVTRGREVVAKSPYVDFEDIVRTPQGVLQELYNVNLGNPYNNESSFSREGNIKVLKTESYKSDIIFLGELNSKKQVVYGTKQYHFTFKVNRVEVSYPEYIQKDDIIKVVYELKSEEDLQEEFDFLTVGEQYLLHAYYADGFEQSYNRGLQVLEGGGVKIEWFFLDKLTQDNLYFYPVKDEKDLDYSDKKLAGLMEFIQLIYENQRSVQLETAKDLSLRPDMQDVSKSHYLVDGRWLNDEDNQKQNNVCVIHDYFAKWRGLSIGDKIKLNIRDMDNSYYLGCIVPYDPDWENWRNYETVEKEFEIVGTYGMAGYSVPSVHGNIWYVPDSTIPEHFLSQKKEKIYSYYYSFVLKSAQDQQVFLAENQEKLDSLGIKVSFLENNADNFGVTAASLKKSTQTSVIIFSMTFLPVMVIVVFFYLSQHRREFAIARAMGISKIQATSQITTAALFIGLPGTVIGGLMAWHNTLKEAKALFQDFVLSNAIEYSSTLPILFILLLLSLFLLFLALILIGCSYLAHQSIFDLLQGRIAKGKTAIQQRNFNKEKSRIKDEIPLSLDNTKGGIPEFRQTTQEQKNSNIYIFTSSIGYLYRHIYRNYGKLLLMILISLGFVATYSWFDSFIEKKTVEIEELYQTVEIQGEILKASNITNYAKGGGFIHPKAVSGIEKSGLVRYIYWEKTAHVGPILNKHPDQEEDSKFNKNPNKGKEETKIYSIPAGGAIAFSNWDTFFQETGKEVTIEFMNGYDKEAFINDRSDLAEAILMESQLTKLGKSYGDIVYIATYEEVIPCRIIGSYKGFLESFVSLPYNMIIMSDYHIEEFSEGDAFYTIVKFTFEPTKNKEFMQKSEELKYIVSSTEMESITSRLVLWDTELRQSIEPMERNLSLIKLIYPIAVIAFTIIGGILNFLMILFRAKEAAIIRVLGGAKRKVRVLFAVEQILTFAIGILLGVLFILVSQGVFSSTIQINLFLYIIGCTLGTFLGSIFVTNKIPLELLQVKE